MAAIIDVRNVRRTFKSVKKNEGIGGLVQLLLKPEYKTHEALKGVTFSIEQGSFVGLIGANGAGKTTLLKILAGLIPPSEGEATVLGCLPFDRSFEFRKQISLVMGQKAQLWWDLPARDAFDLLQAIYDIPKDIYRARVKALSEMLDVDRMLQTQIRRLSLGERMKMELIGAILHWPKVIFLDEPTIGLDVVAAASLRNFLKDFNRKEGATILLTSHNMDDIEQLCPRVLILKEGELVFDGNPQGLVQNDERNMKVSFREPMGVEDLARLTGVESKDIHALEGDEHAPNTFKIALKKQNMALTLGRLFEKCEVCDIGVEREGLEDVIGRLFQKTK